MVSRVMPYVNAATALVPNFGKVSAIGFTVGLLLETFFRPSASSQQHRTRSALAFIQFEKSFQSAQIAMNYFDSPRTKIMGSCLAGGLQLPVVHNRLVRLTGVNAFGNNKTLHYTQIEADRPALVSFVQVAGEMVNIASKILGSLATGLIVQKMVTGDTTGKIRFVVTAALLALSAWNVKNTVHVYSKPSE